MSNVKDRVVIICLDGLSANQFKRLLQEMPRLDSLLEGRAAAELNSAPFADVQPIWAEILTGQPWYRNGCVGYATPARSLNELRLFGEGDLSAPIRLLREVSPGHHHVLINAPILGPDEKRRKWLAEAGLATLTTVSPNTLLESEPFRSYKPRPILSMGHAMSELGAIPKLISVEINRMDCAVAMAEKPDWSLLLYRASIFDQLAHLLGPHYLDEDRLIVTGLLKDFFAKLDEALFRIIADTDRFSVFSSFSHVSCRAMFSLNDFFAQMHLLERTELNAQKSQLRSQAFAMARGSSDESASPLVAEVTQFLSSKTICGSPIRGSVYINSIERFADGLVPQKDIAAQEERIQSLLTTELYKFGTDAKLVRNPTSNSRTPNFIINVDGVDLVEDLEWVVREHQLPLSTHHSRGFIWSKKINGGAVKSVEVADVVSNS